LQYSVLNQGLAPSGQAFSHLNHDPSYFCWSNFSVTMSELTWTAILLFIPPT
jgi:hypothetical protein